MTFPERFEAKQKGSLPGESEMPPDDDHDTLREIVDIDARIEREHHAHVVAIGVSENDRAIALKEAARKLLVELCAVMDEGMREGLLIRWANITINAWGKHDVVDLHVEKRF